MLHRRASAIIRTRDGRLAADAMRAAVAGGFRMIEFTLTTPDAFALIEEFNARGKELCGSDGDLLVGAGTVMTVDDAAQAVRCGAKFIVSAVFDPQVVAAARALGVPSLPGCATPTEMFAAHRAGADFCKLFPAPADIAAWVRAVLAPLPMLRIFPTNGVTAGNVRDVLYGGAAAVGFVAGLFDPEWLASRSFGAIERRARELLTIVSETPVNSDPSTRGKR